MNLSEFKAWFEGFSENLSGAPNKEQWKRIQERIAKIRAEPTPAPVVIREYERYWPRPYWYRDGVYYGSLTGNAAGTLSASNAAFQNSSTHKMSLMDYKNQMQQSLTNDDAYKAIGRAEFDTVQG